MTIATGQKGLASDVNALIPAHLTYKLHNYAVIKTSNETVNNSATLQNDNELVIPVAANEVWEIFMLLIISSGGTPDFKFAFLIPAGASIGKITLSMDETEAAFPNRSTAAPVTIATSGSARPFWTRVFYQGGANAGNIQLQWAQAVADVSNTIVYANSYLLGHRISS